MIFLAIDEMQNAECRMQNDAGANDSWLQPSSSFIIHHSSLPQELVRREDDEARMKQAHLQAGQE